VQPKTNETAIAAKALPKMLELSKPITDKLLKKGFTPLEIPELLNDLNYLIRESKNYTANSINRELENLGWGIQLLDETLFNEITSFIFSIDDNFKQN
jgi:hypothetical protein